MTLPQFDGNTSLESGDLLEFPKRKSPRIPGFSYDVPNYYFITICTHEKKCIFGQPGQLNQMGKIAQENLLKISALYPGIQIDKCVIMPNHIHAIMVINQKLDISLTQVIGQYKMSVTKQIRALFPGCAVWQRSFHDHVIRNQAGYEKIWLYIENNPKKWNEDCFYIAR